MTQAVDLANAINTFVKGCKTDGTWDAIKACCIMAAWDGLDGALYPLKGAAPTNYNFVSGDYNRETGLKGDVSTKYLDSNRAANADPVNDFHLSVYQSEVFTSGAGIIGQDITGTRTAIYTSGVSIRSSTVPPFGTNFIGFLGGSRVDSSGFTFRSNGSNVSAASSSGTPSTANIRVFRRGSSSDGCDSRLAFYSIGEALDLALLDARVTDLITAFGAAIP